MSTSENANMDSTKIFGRPAKGFRKKDDDFECLCKVKCDGRLSFVTKLGQLPHVIIGTDGEVLLDQFEVYWFMCNEYWGMRVRIVVEENIAKYQLFRFKRKEQCTDWHVEAQISASFVLKFISKYRPKELKHGNTSWNSFSFNFIWNARRHETVQNAIANCKIIKQHGQFFAPSVGLNASGQQGGSSSEGVRTVSVDLMNEDHVVEGGNKRMRTRADLHEEALTTTSSEEVTTGLFVGITIFSTNSPLDTSHALTNVQTEVSVVPTDAHAGVVMDDAVEAPVDAADAPVDAADAPVDAAEAPVDAAEAPVDAAEALVYAPIAATNAHTEVPAIPSSVLRPATDVPANVGDILALSTAPIGALAARVISNDALAIAVASSDHRVISIAVSDKAALSSALSDGPATPFAPSTNSNAAALSITLIAPSEAATLLASELLAVLLEANLANLNPQDEDTQDDF